MQILVPRKTVPAPNTVTADKSYNSISRNTGTSQIVVSTLTLANARNQPVTYPINVAATILEVASSSVRRSISYLVIPIDRSTPICHLKSLRLASMERTSLKNASTLSIKITVLKNRMKVAKFSSLRVFISLTFKM